MSSVVLVCAMSVGCAKSAPSTTSAAPTAKTSEPVSFAVPDAPAAKEKQPRMGEAAVYVDGKSIGVLRALELPAALKPELTEYNGVHRVRYGLATYLKTMGVDIATVKAIQFYGGRRVCEVGGDEIRSFGDKLKFSFTMKDRGKPQMHRPSGLKADLSIDMLSGMVIYVNKQPPTIKRESDGSALFYADGTRVKGVPFADEEQGNGTRLYVDGKLTATLKRKTMSNKALLPGDDAHPHFSLPLYLDSVGVDAKNAKAIDFVAGDDVVSRAQDSKSLTFTLPAKSQGKAVFEVPKANAQGETASTRISAIQLYVRTAPPVRTVTPPEQDDVPGSGNGGGQAHQQDDEG